MNQTILRESGLVIIISWSGSGPGLRTRTKSESGSGSGAKSRSWLRTEKWAKSMSGSRSGPEAWPLRSWSESRSRLGGV